MAMLNKLVLLLVMSGAALFAQGLSYTFDITGITDLSHDGVDYVDTAQLLPYERWKASSVMGNEVASSVDSSSSGADWFQLNFADDVDHEWSLLVDNIAGTGTDTLSMEVTITNDATADDLNMRWQPILIQFPETPTISPSGIGPTLSTNANGPVVYASWSTGTLAYWHSDYVNNLATLTVAAGGDEYKYLIAQTAGTVSYKQTDIRYLIIDSGDSFTYTLYWRWGAAGTSSYELAPEAFAAYATSQPLRLKWKDRRPMGRWIWSSWPGDAENPRGYIFGDDVLGDAGQFRLDAIDFVNYALDVMDAMTPKPSAVILWDIEGQEFQHAHSYQGNPQGIADLAPEMDTIIDELIGMIKARGYPVGLTLRKALGEWSNTLPGTCNAGALRGTFTVNTTTDRLLITNHGMIQGAYLWLTTTGTLPAGLLDTRLYVCSPGGGYQESDDFRVDDDVGCGSMINITDAGTGTHTAWEDTTSGYWRDSYIDLDASWPNRGYICNSPDNWVQEGDYKPGVQEDAEDEDAAYDNLALKIQYALTRWGINIYYVDSSNMEGLTGRLMDTFGEDLLILPEHRVWGSYSTTAPYNGDQPHSYHKTHDVVNNTWGVGPFTYHMGITEGQEATAVVGMRKGDALMVDCWFYHAEVGVSNTYYPVAHIANESMGVTDENGKAYSFQDGLEIAQERKSCHPNYFRVVFADDAGGLPASNVYCDSKEEDNCSVTLGTNDTYQIWSMNFLGETCSKGPAMALP